MNIAVDPTAILPNPYGRIQLSGTVFDVDESLLYTDQVDIRYNLSETGTLSDEKRRLSIYIQVLPFHAGERKAALSKHIYGVVE